MSMLKGQFAVVATLLAVAAPAAAQSSRWVQPKCDIKAGHHLINSGVLYLRNATDTRFDDQKQKDLRDANRVLTQAITANGQDKNPAAWYYLRRYNILQQDRAGADTAFSRAVALKPD